MAKVDEPIPYVPVETREVWPSDDMKFRRFAANIADTVMWAEARGWLVAERTYKRGNECCPLGAGVAKSRGFGPDKSHAISTYPGVLSECENLFAKGFDGHPSYSSNDPYYRLGEAYRRRALAMHGGV